MRLSSWLFAIAGSLLIAGAIGRASRLPRHALPPAGPAPDVSGTTLATAITKIAARHKGLSGVYLLSDALEAFATRMALVRHAEKTLDLQYYIWRGDRTGTLLLEAVLEAADRGVRVRLLLDDNGIDGLDNVLFALDRHPNIEVRLFNPFPIRWPKAIGYAFDFRRLNRRMHNKSLTVDGHATIVGGRNIGDEYFGVEDGPLFADLDVLAVGPVVADVGTQFDRYWNASSAFPARLLLRRVGPRDLRRLRRRSSIVERDPAARRYVEALRDLEIVRELAESRLPMEWAKVRLFADDPTKALGLKAGETRLAGLLENVIGTPQRELQIISGYFVPGRIGVADLTAMRLRGVDISILTNAYEATDVGVVHAGYAPYRKDLVAAGIKLYEMRAQTRQAPTRKERRRGARMGVARRLRGSGNASVSALRAGATTLHAKTFSVDRERLFVGSFNFDPRSVDLNTEMGVLIESPNLAGIAADLFRKTVPQMAYRIVADDSGHILWQDAAGRRLAREPGMGIASRAAIGLLKRLNIEWLL
ncbi:phospholipase D family protein [Aliihoeflea aestuarii]|uniref:phospholipase D family protein n=1 Tax=Aliihoeflea aestuarii TaxID=453840 RepID=UPI00209284BC|nr:phospholipase D family protein [Aliihoeflea aestuarii]MCO6391063.1 phospholipase D family protein [Aliihoeflea aestuarii]